MAETTTSDGLVAGLLDNGIDTVFGIPGGQTYGLFDAFHRARGKLRVIGGRHEQACSLMAFGYTRSSGKPSAYSVVPGPGVMNASGGMLTAWGCNEPTLLLTGQVPSAFLDKGRGHLHEMRDQLATMRTFVKWAERVEAPSAARSTVSRAVQQMLSGRRGPAAIEVPWDTLTARGDIGPAVTFDPFPKPTIDGDSIDKAAGLINAATHPMIFVGSGAIGAADAVRALAEMLQAPVAAMRSGRGIVGNDHPLGLTMASAMKLWGSTDLAIGIGSRMETASWLWGFRPPGVKTIRIDIDPAEMRRSPVDVAIVGDSADALAMLNSAVSRPDRASAEKRRSRVADAVAGNEAAMQAVQPQVSYLQAMRDVLPRNAIVTDEPCQLGFASWYGLPVYEPRTFISSGFQGNLGAGFTTALGAKVAHPDRPVVAITGDGGFMFAASELATAVQYGIGVVVVVYNNNGFENCRRDQRDYFGGRVIGADLVNPDFMKLAGAFGVKSRRVADAMAFRSALDVAVADGGPYLIEITVPSDTNPWSFIRSGAPG